MFKRGRGGAGRGGGSRPPPPPPQSRPASAPGPGRLSIGGGGGRSRPGSAAGGGVPPGQEESFVLDSPTVLDFGAIIRLTPDLVEEIRRVESQGGSAKIKFASNSTIPNGNVIDVGGKEFGFTWSRDDLCDIYEERQSGECGDGVLVERGSAWRKLNVLRTLDETTKKHVKKRSEEAERLLKSRKAIILDPTNPSMKNPVKMMAAAGVEGNMRRMGWKQKKEPFFKKQKVDSNQVSNVGPPKSVYKSGTYSNRTTKGMPLVSPISSPPEQLVPGSAVSPIATGISSKGETKFEEITPSLDINKEHIDIGSFDQEIPIRSAQGIKHKVGIHKGRAGDQPVDLQGGWTKKAPETSMGTSLKALEKGEESISNPKTKKGSAIKDIEAPGECFKPEVEVEQFNQRESERGSGSPPESAHDIVLTIESIFGENVADASFEQHAQQTSKKDQEEEDPFEKIDIMQDDPVPFSNVDTKVSRDSAGKTSSSESGSDSDSESDSSDSESDSGSQSRSPARSGSSSDSDSDGSSSTKEGSDVDVDIMSEGEKEELLPKTDAADLNLFSSPGDRGSDGEQLQIDILGDQEEKLILLPIDLNEYGRDNLMTNPGDGAKDLPSNNIVNISKNPEIKLDVHMDSGSYKAAARFPEVPVSSCQYKHSEDPQMRFVKSPSDTNEQVTKKTVSEKHHILHDWSAHEKKETIKKNKSKRASSSEFVKAKSESAKRSKGAKDAELMPYRKRKDGDLPVNSQYISPKKSLQDQDKSNNAEWSGTKDIQDYSLADRSRSVAFGNPHKIQQSPGLWSSSSVDAEQPGSRTGDIIAHRKPIDRFNKNTERMHFRPDTMTKDKLYKNTLDEPGVGENPLSIPEYDRKSGDHDGDVKDNGQPLRIRRSDWDKSPLVSAKGAVLRREASELELGELREPHAGGEALGVNRQSEGKNFFKPSDSNKDASTGNRNLDISKGRSGSNLPFESKQLSPQDLRGESHGNQEGFHRKMPPDDPVDTSRILQRTMPSQGQQHFRADNSPEVKSHLDNLAELAHRGEVVTNQGMGLENNAGSLKKNHSILPPQHDIKHGSQKVYKNAKESKQPKPNKLEDSVDRINNGVSVESETNGRKIREPSTEDENSFYAKYDKEMPNLRESIKDFMQYNDYVQEYREKYDCYISLNKNLENIRNDFLKVGEELELAKGRGLDEYYKVVEQLREMYHQHGERNKQMKRVFILLHEELKTLKQRIKDFVEMH